MMTVAVIAVAVRMTQWWARVYTRHLPASAAAARRTEIESDLWEWLHDPDRAASSPLATAVLLLLRLGAGIPDDLAWRAEQQQRHGLGRTRWPLAGAVVMIALTSLWLWSLTRIALPPTPPAPRWIQHERREPPPPPPPPPSASGRAARRL